MWTAEPITTAGSNPPERQGDHALRLYMARADLANPVAGLILDAKENLYGTPEYGDDSGLPPQQEHK